MLYFKEETQGERNLENYKAIKVLYEGEPNLVVACGYNEFINIDETGDICCYNKIDETEWWAIVEIIYDRPTNVEIVDYYKDFDITISKRV